MINYLAITQPTADWLMAKPSHLQDFYEILPTLCTTGDLQDTSLVLGTFRAAASKQSSTLCVWNADYLSSTGIENWGVIRLSQQLGLFSKEQIIKEVLERSLYVLNQRLQGLLADDRMIHRSWDDNVHTCLSGRGEEARQFSIGYTEGNFQVGNSAVRAVLCVGPSNDFTSLVATASSERNQLGKLVLEAQNILMGAPKRPAIDAMAYPTLRGRFRPKSTQIESDPIANVPTLHEEISENAAYVTVSMSYDAWMNPDSPLTATQRRIVESDILLHRPMRIVGAAGSGKSLVMQLLAIRRLREAEMSGMPLKILYLVHNSAMMDTMFDRFVTLGAEKFLLSSGAQVLTVSTLFSHSRDELGVDQNAIIDGDAYQTKQFQTELVRKSIRDTFTKRINDLQTQDHEGKPGCPLLLQIAAHDELMPLFSELVSLEIGVAIKGHGLNNNRKRYVSSEQALSRLHGVLTETERNIVFDAFEGYNREIFEEASLLDSDDVAISLLGRLRTPLWNLRRRKLGHDFVFVDETQLFNENERRLFPLLTRGDRNYVPIALALDEAQEIRGAISSGFGLLGIEAIADESLRSIHRSTKAIITLAFHIIQRTTDLFGPEFPDFTLNTVAVVPDNHHLAAQPKLITAGADVKNFGKFVLRQVRALRQQNLRQICVVIHSGRYWDEVREAFEKEEKQLIVLTQRGEQIDPRRPVVVLARPENVGGQEFDAVVSVGLEQGLVPPRAASHDGLATALEQQALREMYLAFTRARFRLVLVIPSGAAPSGLLEEALKTGLLECVTAADRDH